MKWIDALKKWNEGKGAWCIPKKGTPQHAEVISLMHEVPKKTRKLVKAEPKMTRKLRK